MFCLADIQRILKEKEADTERLERQKELLNSRLQQLEKDLQVALRQEQQSHEEDVDRLNREKVIATLNTFFACFVVILDTDCV